MKHLLSVTEMQRVDAETEVPVDRLMDAAGHAVALVAADMGIGYGTTVQVLCGKGNNGGDGYVAAAYLKGRGARVVVQQLAPPEPDSPAGRAEAHARSVGVRVVPLGEPEPADLLIDALFGTGFTGSLPDVAIPWLVHKAPVLAVDIPSGLNGDSGLAEGPRFIADRTVTFHLAKTGHYLGLGPDVCGGVSVHDIGLSGGDPLMHVLESSDVSIPQRTRQTHKWRAGAVATVGGVAGLTGAALFAARSALRAGAGVSTLLTTAATDVTYEVMAPEIPTMQASESTSWKDHASELLSLLGRFDTLIVGPGLEPAPVQFVETLVESFGGSLVLDAGALGAIADLGILFERKLPSVLTPHAGEFTRLSGAEPSPESARRLAVATGSVIVLKGNPTIVAGKAITLIDNAGPELATIGTGDVLSGIIGALLAQGVDAEEAAQSGVWIHGEAGASLARRQTVTADALVDEVAAVMARL